MINVGFYWTTDIDRKIKMVKQNKLGKENIHTPVHNE